MFVQVISGAVGDAEAIKAHGDRWYAELRPGATGWLGTTAGVTTDGTFVLLARFDSAESAQRNSDRPEQGAWWAEAESSFTGDVSFADYDDVYLARGGGSDDAGFVQVMLGRTSDPARQRQLNEQFEEFGSQFRPDVLGGVIGIRDDGQFAQAFYFTSEAEARAAEQQEMPEEVSRQFAEEEALTTEIRYFDLTSPWLYS